MRFPIRSRTVDELANLATPMAGQLEAVEWEYYDTQTITSGTTTVLNFFTQVQSDKTLGNLEQAGSIQAPNWYELYTIRCDFLRVPTLSTTANLGALDDLAEVLFAQRATAQLTVNSKSYGVKPLTSHHQTGGAVGFTQGTPATAGMVSYANNSVADDGLWLGGWWLNPRTNMEEECGSIVLAPSQSFQFAVSMAAAPTLSAALNVRITFGGVLHRQVR